MIYTIPIYLYTQANSIDLTIGIYFYLFAKVYMQVCKFLLYKIPLRWYVCICNYMLYFPLYFMNSVLQLPRWSGLIIARTVSVSFQNLRPLYNLEAEIVKTQGVSNRVIWRWSTTMLMNMQVEDTNIFYIIITVYMTGLPLTPLYT